MCVWLAASPSTYHPKESPLAAVQVNVAVVFIAAATDSGVSMSMSESGGQIPLYISETYCGTQFI